MAQKKSVIFTWISYKDVEVALNLMASKPNPEAPRRGQFSILLMDKSHTFDEIVGLYTKDLKNLPQLEAWSKRFSNRVTFKPCYDVDSKEYRSIYDKVTQILEDYRTWDRNYLISGGSKAMGLVWVFAHVNAHYSGNLYNAYDLPNNDLEGIIKQLKLPFKIDATYIEERARQQVLDDWDQVEALNDIVIASQQMENIYKHAHEGAIHKIPIMIYGESGTGKEMLAKYCAQAAKRPKVYPVNCGALPKELVESELFGHVKGAFTGAGQNKKGIFEEAKGQTLFLDEIGELPLEAQAKLLRVIQERTIRRVGDTKEIPVDVYLIAATNRQLHLEVEAGRFREDLFYRLMIWPITLPPLCERLIDDRQKLIKFLWEKTQDKYAGRTDPIPRSLNQRLADHHWPGNIRQLENALVQLFGRAINNGGKVSQEMVEAVLNQPAPRTKKTSLDKDDPSMEYHMAQAFVSYFEEVYKTKRTQRETAKALNMNVNTMIRQYQKNCDILGRQPILATNSKCTD